MDSEKVLSRLQDYIATAQSAIRLRVDLQPAGGSGDKFLPPTYKGGSYAEEERLLNGQMEKTVLVNSVASEAARLEAALKQGLEEKEVSFPVVSLEIDGWGTLLELDLPHRLFDAYLLYSEVNGTPFWESEAGREVHCFERPAATGLYKHSPVTLLFGGWDTHALNEKSRSWRFRFPRTLVSEIVAFGVSPQGKGVSSKGDPFNLTGTLYEARQGAWTPTQTAAKTDDKGQPVKFEKTGQPSILGFGQITPSFVMEDGTGKPGGYTAREIRQVTVLSLPALRRLRFPGEPGGANDAGRNDAARVVLAAIGLYAISKAHAEGHWLRSRCHLVAQGVPELEFVRADGTLEKAPLPTPNIAADAFQAAVKAAEEKGLVWRKKPLVAKPSKPLLELIRQQGIQ